MSNSALSAAEPRIVVVGSINMDLVARMERLPRPGETVSGIDFQSIPGGKGANQAVAASRLGATTRMIARLGEDSFGTSLRQQLVANGINIDSILSTPNCSSGVALIGVDASGMNSITVIPGANGQLSARDVEQYESVIAESAALIVQLETPLETVCRAIEIARQHQVLTILDPAPVPSGTLPDDLFQVDFISPNQTEAELLTGVIVDDWSSAQAAAQVLQFRGAKNIVLKMGALGAFVRLSDGTVYTVSAPQTKIVDTTAAGDAFTAGLTVGLCEGKSAVESTRFACMAGTFACTQFGAQPAMPTRQQLQAWAVNHENHF